VYDYDNKKGVVMLGIGKGKIDIVIPKAHFASGDIISGNVRLTLKKPSKARQLCISLIGEYKSTEQIRNADGHMSTSTQTRKVYDFEVQLDTEKEYSGTQEYPFEIKIPSDIQSVAPQMPEIEGAVGKGIKIAQAAAAMTGKIPLQRVKWYLSARLDIAGGLDVKKRADITIG